MQASSSISPYFADHNCSMHCHHNPNYAPQQIQYIVKYQYKKAQQFLDLKYLDGICWTVLRYGNGKEKQIQDQIKSGKENGNYEVDWSNLKKLSLFSCEVEDQNLKNILTVEWRNLEYLQLFNNCHITLKGLKSIFQTRKFNNNEVENQNKWPSLRGLRIGDYEQVSKIGDEGFKIIFDSQRQKWQLLQLCNCKITPEALKYPLNFSKLNIKNLYIQKNPLGSKGALLLSRIDMPNLQVLDINTCQIGSEGLNALVKGNWRKMREMWIDHNRFSWGGIEELGLANWANLEILGIQTFDKMYFISGVFMERKKGYVLFQQENIAIQEQIKTIFTRRFLN